MSAKGLEKAVRVMFADNWKFSYWHATTQRSERMLHCVSMEHPYHGEFLGESFDSPHKALAAASQAANLSLLFEELNGEEEKDVEPFINKIKSK